MVQIFCAKAAIAFWFPFSYFDLKDSKHELFSIVIGTLLQILDAYIYETVSVPHLTVLGVLEYSGIKFFIILKIVTVWDVIM